MSNETEAVYDTQLISQFPALYPVTHKSLGPISLQWPESSPPYLEVTGQFTTPQGKGPELPKLSVSHSYLNPLVHGIIHAPLVQGKKN